jgi:hypothetical protein
MRNATSMMLVASGRHSRGSTNGDWVHAVNAERGTEAVEVWTSDQGFSTQARFTWPFESVLRLARAYFEEGYSIRGSPGGRLARREAHRSPDKLGDIQDSDVTILQYPTFRVTNAMVVSDDGEVGFVGGRRQRF